MTEEITTIESRVALTQKLAEVLQTWPLYRRFNYAGKHDRYKQATGLHGMGETTFTLLPEEICLLCLTCKKEQRWSVGCAEVYPTTHQATYRCRNCGTQEIEFFFHWELTETGGTFRKAGQYPPLTATIQLPIELEKQLSKTDLDYYRKALTCRNSCFGLASLSYLRRVIENAMNSLIDLIGESAKESGDNVDELESVKTSRRFEDKAAFGAKILPSHLKPGGHNPVEILHQLSSEGLHSKSEDECLEIFDKTRLAFEYLFKNLCLTNEEAKAYSKTIGQLARKDLLK